MKFYSLALLLGAFSADAKYPSHHGLRVPDNKVADLATDTGTDLLTTFAKIFMGRTDEVLDSIKSSPRHPAEDDVEPNYYPLVKTFDYYSNERGLSDYLMTEVCGWWNSCDEYGMSFRINGDFMLGWNMPIYSGEENGREMFVVNP